MSILSLAWKSLLNRRVTVFLTLFSLAISVCLLLGVEKIRSETRHTFNSTVSSTDLIVGARTSSLQLLLSSVFHMGDVTSNLSWQAYQDIAKNPLVTWTIPISLGDSHRGFRVIGTNNDYLKHYKYGRKQPLRIADGSWFSDLHDTVLGAEVARKLGYNMGDELILSHGSRHISFLHHDDHPFRISGILAATGTPVDQSVHVSLSAIEAIHIDLPGNNPGRSTEPHSMDEQSLQPSSISAAFVGLRSRISSLQLQRSINEYPKEALIAILPGVTLRQLWNLVGSVEKALMAISALVVFACLIGMLTTLLTSMNERRREMAILRALGARPWHIFTLILSESALLASLGSILGLALLYLLMLIVKPMISQLYGVQIDITAPGSFEYQLLAIIISGALLMGTIPAWLAYRHSLSDGLSLRV